MADPDSSIEQNHSKPKRFKGLGSKKAQVLGIGLVVICLVAGGAYFITNKNDQNSQQADAVNPEAPIIPVDKIPQPVTDHDKTIVAADKLIAAQDYGGAIKLLEPYDATLTDPALRYPVEARLGNLYSYKQDYKNAITWFERAQTTGQPGADNLYLDIATAAEKAGDKPKAIAAYRKIVEIIKQRGNVSGENGIQRYEEKIKSLGG